MRKTKLDRYKQSAPEIPTITCPYIDFVQDILKEVKDECNSVFCEQKLDLAESSLEYIRQSNESLRQSSQYWYVKCKSALNGK